MSAVLLVRLKIPDLTALTALDTARTILPQGHEITRLVREELYLFEPAQGSTSSGFEAPLERSVETSNFFVNPNKERYAFTRAGNRGEALAPPAGAWGILTRPRGETRDEGLRERLVREHPLEGLGPIRRGRLWWLWTRAEGLGGGSDIAYRALGPVEGPDRGLLVNPHAEAALRIEGPMPWSRIETFLAEPAPALEPSSGVTGSAA